MGVQCQTRFPDMLSPRRKDSLTQTCNKRHNQCWSNKQNVQK